MAVPETDVPALLAQSIELVPIDSIEPHPDNPNEGDVGAINSSIERIGGFYQVIFVQLSTRRILAGEHRWRTLKARGSEVAPVVFLDVDDEAALAILIGDNEIPRQHSRANESRLGDLLLDLQQGSRRGLVGTGFDDAALDNLLARLASAKANPIDAEREWDGMPPFVQHDLNSAARVTIHFRSDEDADAFFKEIARPRRKSMWWPVDDEHVGSDVHQEYVGVGDDE